MNRGSRAVFDQHVLRRQVHELGREAVAVAGLEPAGHRGGVGLEGHPHLVVEHRAPLALEVEAGHVAGERHPHAFGPVDLDADVGLGPEPLGGDLGADPQVLAGHDRAGPGGPPLGAAVVVHGRDAQAGTVGEAPDGEHLVLPHVLVGVVPVGRQRAGLGQRIERGLHVVPQHVPLGGIRAGQARPDEDAADGGHGEQAGGGDEAGPGDRPVSHRPVAVVAGADPGDGECGEHHALEQQRGRQLGAHEHADDQHDGGREDAEDPVGVAAGQRHREGASGEAAQVGDGQQVTGVARRRQAS